MPPTSTAHDGRAARAPVANNAANWFTVPELSQRWDIPERTIQRWILSGKLAAVRLPSRSYRVYAEAVAELETELTA
jgi:excisionase family DNA binding protein